MRSMSLIDKSVPVEYRYAFSTAFDTALLQQLFLPANDIAPNNNYYYYVTSEFYDAHPRASWAANNY